MFLLKRLTKYFTIFLKQIQ